MIRKEIFEMTKEISEKKNDLLVYHEGILLDEEFKFDSLMVIQLITDLEDKYEIEFNFDTFDIENIYSLDKIIENVKLALNNEEVVE